MLGRMSADAKTNREDAWKFLKGLEQHLDRNICPLLVRESLKENKGPNYESDFVNTFVLPKISEYLQQTLSPADAFKAFLTESVDARKKGIASGTPASAHRHLFTKVLGVPAKTLVEMWWGRGSPSPKAAQIGLSARRRACTP